MHHRSDGDLWGRAKQEWKDSECRKRKFLLRGVLWEGKNLTEIAQLQHFHRLMRSCLGSIKIFNQHWDLMVLIPKDIISDFNAFFLTYITWNWFFYLFFKRSDSLKRQTWGAKLPFSFSLGSWTENMISLAIKQQSYFWLYSMIVPVPVPFGHLL